ncbi:hypothetical protein SO802_017013 [Lithocarpus litseifolius]|uniref:Uncharacterized protein n=1 Tax=Lithocarpus litseifolius TaxID=425828 RepID=A0AAW2CY40_9ROSI
MAKCLGDSELWLPSKFLTETEALMDKENFNKNGFNTTTTTTGFEPSLIFPTEFPYEFDSFGSSSALSSPVESVAGSTETESSDEEDFFAGLTRRLTQSSLQETQKLTVPSSFSHTKPEWVIAGSPQSTLSGIGSWSGRSGVSSNGSPNGPSQFPSPPTTPFGAQNDTWDLIYAAAGQVARLKVSGESQKYNPQSRGLLSYPNTTPAASKSCNFGLYPNQPLTHNLPQTAQFQHVMKSQCSSIWGRQQVKVGLATLQQREPQLQTQSRVRSTNGYESGRSGARSLGLPQSAWPSLQAQQQSQVLNPNGSSMRAGVLLSGSNTSVKRECAGTGVFLPRRYSNPPDSRKKTSMF